MSLQLENLQLLSTEVYNIITEVDDVVYLMTVGQQGPPGTPINLADLLDVSNSATPSVSRRVLISNGTEYEVRALVDADLPTGINADKIADGSVSNTEFQFLDGVTSNLQTQINSKSDTSYVDSGLATKASLSHTHNASDIADGSVSNSEFQTLNGVTSSIQSQLDAKASSLHSHAFTDLTGTVTNSQIASGIDATKIGSGNVDNIEYGYLNGVTSSLQTQIDAKASIAYVDTGDATTASNASAALASGLATKANTSHTHNATNIADGSVTDAEFQRLAGVTSNIQTQLNSKSDSTHTHAFSTLTGTVSNSQIASGIDASKIGSGIVSNAEYGFLDGVTSLIQGQLDGKASTSHTHSASDITSGTLAAARIPASLTASIITAIDATGISLRNNSGTEVALMTSTSLRTNSLQGRTGRLAISPGSGGAQDVLEVWSRVSVASGIAFGSFPDPGAGGIYAQNKLVLGNAGSITPTNNELTGTSAGPRLNANTGLTVGLTVNNVSRVSATGTGVVLNGSVVAQDGDITLSVGTLYLPSAGTPNTGFDCLSSNASGPMLVAGSGKSSRLQVGATVNSNFGAAFGVAGTDKWAVGRYGVLANQPTLPGIASDGTNNIHNVPSAGSHFFRVNDADRFRVHSNGNVYQHALTGQDSAYYLENNNYYSRLYFTTSASSPAGAGTWGQLLGFGSNGLYLYGYPNLVFFGNTTERLRITASGIAGASGTSPIEVLTPLSMQGNAVTFSTSAGTYTTSVPCVSGGTGGLNLNTQSATPVRATVAGTTNSSFGAGFDNTTSYCFALGRHGVVAADNTAPGIASAGANINYHSPYQHIITNGTTPRYNWRSGYALGVYSDYAWGAGEYATSLTAAQAGIGSPGDGDLFLHVANTRFEYFQVNTANNQRRGNNQYQFMGAGGAILGNNSNNGIITVAGGSSGNRSAGAFSVWNSISAGGGAPGSVSHYTGSNAGAKHFWLDRNGSIQMRLDENGVGAANTSTPLLCSSPLRAVGSFQQGANGICSPPIEIPRGGTNLWSAVSLASPNPVQTTVTGQSTPGGWASQFADSAGTNVGQNLYQLDDLIPVDTSRCYEGEIWARLSVGVTSGTVWAGFYCYNSSGSLLGAARWFINSSVNTLNGTGTVFRGTISGEGGAANQFFAGTAYVRFVIIVQSAYSSPWTIQVGSARIREIEHQTGLRNSAAQAISSHASTNYALTWNTQEFITSTQTHSTSTNPSRWTCPRSGRYRVNAYVEMDAATTGIFRVEVWRNGALATGCSRRQPNLAGYNPGLAGQCNLDRTLDLTAGDYLEVMVGQDSGSAINATTNCYFQVTAEN